MTKYYCYDDILALSDNEAFFAEGAVDLESFFAHLPIADVVPAEEVPAMLQDAKDDVIVAFAEVLKDAIRNAGLMRHKEEALLNTISELMEAWND